MKHDKKHNKNDIFNIVLMFEKVVLLFFHWTIYIFAMDFIYWKYSNYSYLKSSFKSTKLE